MELDNKLDNDLEDINEEETNGIIEYAEDETKIAYTKILEFITNTFYPRRDNDNISIIISSDNETLKGSTNYYDGDKIVLSARLMDAFGEINLPRFLIYYHELGHHLYSQGYFNLLKAWRVIKQGPLQYEQKYDHLLNWIEDFYIENRLIQEHSYLTDVINCIKKLPPEYPIDDIKYAFNFWYIYQAATPALAYPDQLSFKTYITTLLNIRDSRSTRFGRGILTTVSIKQSTETKFVLLLIEFYNWCVSKKIFSNNKPLPKLQNPNNHLESPDNNTGTNNGNSNNTSNASGDSDSSDSDGNNNSKTGAYSPHSGKVGQGNPDEYQEVSHIKSPTPVFKEELASEKRLVNKQLLDMSQRLQMENVTLDGLFTTTYKDSSIIQSKIILPNFFNPNRVVDQILFKEKQHTYMNVAIYRDISGSTTGNIHRLMSAVCEQLYKDIPVDITYYLYASGDISIVELPYITWENDNNPPPIYKTNKLFQQLGGGTNSGAIADVITQQLSEKWLNIIITDGDLYDLMNRDNIQALLKNVFVISIQSDVKENLLGIRIDSVADLDKINPVLATINL